MSEVEDNLFGEGQHAFESGLGMAVCPYRPEGDARRWWLAGWDEARRYFKQGHQRTARPMDGAAASPGDPRGEHGGGSADLGASTSVTSPAAPDVVRPGEDRQWSDDKDPGADPLAHGAPL